nr:MAG: Prophage endopeptidase tail [Bacteriophage sp.]
MANEVNPILNIYNEDGTPFHDISLRKHTFSTIVMSLNDKIEGEFYYKDNSLSFTLQEYVEYKGIKYILKNPPVVVRKGMTSENSEAKGMTKYSCTFYHEMIELYNIPFTDIAISSSEESYRSEKRTFSWIGTLSMFVQKINSCLVGTKWTCKLQPTFVDDGTMSDVLSFSNQFISDVCKTAYETWKVPFVVDGYTIWFGKPSKEILDDENKPYIFKFGQGVGLKNNDCTPKNNKVITRIAGYGSNINIPYGYPIITDADGNRIEHPYTRDTLMPSVYVEAVRNKVLFGSKEPLIDYYDADSSYPTPINPLAPVFHIQEFSSIQPTIEGMTYKGQAIDLFKEVIVPEGGWDDYIDPETGEVRQSYFDVTLYPLGFDLYAQAAVTSGMTFSMKSGDTLGANYEVAVDWEDVKKNFYVTDEAGNIVFKPNGEQRDYAKYPDSTDQAITIKLTKDLDTFGTIMPSKFQQVKTGDKFVILHIEMPQAYIDKAQERLDVTMKRYMLENNMPLYDYPLSFDEHFLETNQAILAQIKPNTIVRFLYKDNEDAMELSVKEMSIQYGTNPLPTYNITLTDEVSIVLNQIGQIADGLSKLGSQVAQLQAIYGLDIVGELNKKLSRVKDDTAQGMITFLRGLKVGSYVTGSTGGIFYADTDGKSHAELDYLTVRMKAMFYALEIIKTGVIGGRQMITPGGAIECIKIEDRNDILDEEGNKTGENIWDYWRCYFYQDDGTEALDNRFRAGDMALAQDFNIKEGVYENVSNHYFWRLVVNVGTNYIDISKTDADAASDAPRVGDTICQLGNKTFVDANDVTHVEDKTRQNAIIFSAVDTFSPSMTLYAGINSYSYLNKEYVSYGVDKTTNLAYMNVYGNSYIGARDKSSYMKFDTVTGVEIKGKLVTKSGKDVEETFNSFQDQIDGVKETWYGEYTPTLTNQPAVDWNTEALKKRHEGDVFTNIQEYVDDETTPDAGKSWRWVKTGDTWGWKQIADNDTSKAYLEAAKAQKAAEEAKKEANDAKQTVTNMKDFTDEAFKDGIVDRQEAAAIEKYLNSIKSIQKSVAESYSKVYANPLLSGTAKVELKTAYDGFNVATTELITAIDDAIADGVATSTEVALVDGRYDTFNTKYGDFIAYLNAANNFIQDKINTSAEDAKKAAEEAQKAADAAKAEAEAAKQRLDKWAEDGVISPTEKQSIKDEIVRIDADKTNITAGYTLYSLGSPTGYLNAHSNYRAVLVTLSASTPENITIPSDFASKQSAYYNQRTAALNAISDAAKAAVDTVKKDLAGYEYLKKAWKESTTIEGGVIQNALNMLGYTDPVAGFKVMSGMNGVYDATKVGGGIASWYGGSMKDRADYTEANMPSDVAKAIIRMDGSGYLASGAVWWGTDGVFHADPQSFIIKENQLGDYVSLFQIVYRSGTPKTISYMIPQYPMQKLTVSDYIEIGTTGYRIGVDSANNAIKVYKEDGSAVNFYATGAVSAKGISSGSGGGGGGLIDTVYGYSSLGGTFADSTLSDTFNAYTINKLASRITELEKNGGGGTGIAGIKVNDQTYVPDANKYITLPDYPTITAAKNLETYSAITSAAVDTIATFTASKTSVWEANGTAYGTTGANDTVLNIGSAANRLFQLRAAYNSDDFYLRGVGASSFRTWYKVLHEGNYASALDSKYLKLSGGTLTGTLTVGDTSISATVITVKSSHERGTYIQFVNGTTPTVEVGYDISYGAYLYNDKLDSHPTLCLGLADNLREAIIYKYAGVNYNVWHSGSLKPYQFTGWSDARSVNHVPNDYNGLFIMRGIKKLTTIGLSDSGSYATVWGWRGWQDKNGGHAWEIASTNNDLYTRHGETTSWTSWAKILNSSNYKDYMHDRFGTSGLIVYSTTSNEINFGGTYTDSSNIYFGYNSKDNRPRPTEYHFGQNDASLHGKYFQSHIPTGTQPFQCVSTTTCTNLNADLLDGFHGSAESTANTYVRRNQYKYISVNYINSDTAKNENHDFTQIITTDDGDNYYRKAGIRFFMKRLNSYTKTIDLKSLDANKYYPISFQLVQKKSFIRIKIWNCLDGNKPTWATHTSGFAAAIEWDTTANAWGSQYTQRIIYADNYIHCDKSPCGGIEQNTRASVEIVYLRGGAIYYYNNNDNIEAIINSNGYSWTSSTYSYSAPVINNIKNRAYSCYNLSLRSFSTLYCNDIISYRLNISSTSTFSGKATFNGGLSGTLTGSLSGNATTATTLQTSRTINGTSFNGSANITTSYWGTTRTFYINDPSGAHYNSYSVNGSGNVDMYLPSTMTGFSSITSTTFSGSLSGNASSASTATKLTNTRTIWGQSFNGTANVSGSLTDVASITASGNITAAGAITAKSSSSDIRLKKNIKQYNALDIIHKLKSVKYYWNDTAKANSPIFNDNEEHYGLIAQDLLINGYSQWVSNCFKDYYVIQYERLIPVLWRGIQQVDNEVATLKKKIATLEKELSSVKRQLSL